MAAYYPRPYDDIPNAMSNLMSSSRPSQRFSVGSGTFSSIHSTRSSRVEKPRSSHNSPRQLERRMTTTRSFPYHSRNSTTSSGNLVMQDNESYADISRRHRPMSWHPMPANSGHVHHQSSMGFGNQTYHQISPSVGYDAASTSGGVMYPYNLTADRPLPSHFDSSHIQSIQPMPYEESPVHIDPYFSCQTIWPPADFSSPPSPSAWDLKHIPPLNIPSRPQAQAYQQSPIQPTSYEAPFNNDSYFSYPTSTPTAFSSPPSPSVWDLKHFHPLNFPSMPQTQAHQNFLPIQQPPELEDDDSPRTPLPALDMDDNDGKELIGMGLYDPPATPPHPFMSALNKGKGLLLEKHWQPPPMESDDEDEGDDEKVETESEIKNPTPSARYGLPLRSHNAATHSASHQWPRTQQRAHN